MEVDSSVIWDLFCSKQFMLCPGAVIHLKVVPCPLSSYFSKDSIHISYRYHFIHLKKQYGSKLKSFFISSFLFSLPS